MELFRTPFIILFLISGAMAETINFDDVKQGQLPKGWTAGLTGRGAPKWSVGPDPSAPSRPNVLKQSGEATFPVAVKEDVSTTNGSVEVKFKPISGNEDQAAGIVWRFRDFNNYYVVRANALENNVVLYKTENGKRSSLDIKGRRGGYGVKQTVPSQQWSTLRVTFSGPLFTVFLNGKQLFKAEDQTFTGPGAVGVWTKADAVGVWTKADSVTLFDDFIYEGN